MSSSLKVKLSERKDKSGTPFWEGAVTYPGLRGKLTRRSDDGTQFSTRAAAQQAARNLGKAMGVEATFDEPVVKRAAKKSATKAKKTKTPTCTNTAATTPPPWLG